MSLQYNAVGAYLIRRIVALQLQALELVYHTRGYQKVLDTSLRCKGATVNTKSEECVTLHSDFLEMSYELNFKMKCVISLLFDTPSYTIHMVALYQKNISMQFSFLRTWFQKHF